MPSVLLVPVQLDALWLTAPTSVVDPTIDCTRLPYRQGNTAVLVAVDHRYGAVLDERASIELPASADARVRLVCLHSWNFYCKEVKGSLTDMLESLSANAQPLHAPLKIGDQTYILTKARVADSTSATTGAHTWVRGPLLPPDAGYASAAGKSDSPRSRAPTFNRR